MSAHAKTIEKNENFNIRHPSSYFNPEVSDEKKMAN
jgi:hypothetical protein